MLSDNKCAKNAKKIGVFTYDTVTQYVDCNGRHYVTLNEQFFFLIIWIF